ncbi:MAG: cytochrome c1 [Gallionella sp.]|jgi:cytochrome c1
MNILLTGIATMETAMPASLSSTLSRERARGQTNRYAAFTLAALLCAIPLSVWASSEAELEKVTVDTSRTGIARGADILMNNCHSCHSLKYIKYRDLINLGLDKQKVDEWRGEQPLDGSLQAQMSESDATQAFGKAPPDLSLMAKARDGGVNYVYSYLLGYYVTPEGMPGNHIYPATKMPDPLGISSAADDAAKNAIRKQARDIVSFLAWTSDPHEQDRKRLGYYVIGYLIVLTLLLYLLKNQIWSRLK